MCVILYSLNLRDISLVVCELVCKEVGPYGEPTNVAAQV